MSRPSSLHDVLVDRIGRMVVSGAFGSSGALPREDELAETFSVSRTVIREVTKTLRALGLVTTGPRVGSRIQPIANWRLLDPQVMAWITDADMTNGFERDLLEIRSMVEPAAAAFAAERGADLQIEAITTALGAMTNSTDISSHEAADLSFHEAILEASGNLLLVQLKPILHAVLKASFRLSMHDYERGRASVNAHKRVADAITARAPEDARETMAELLAMARADIEQGARWRPDESPTKRKSEEMPHDSHRRKVDLTRA